MTKDVKPLSSIDISFIKQQLKISTITISIFGLFVCVVLYIMFEGLWIVQIISFCLVLLAVFYIRGKVFNKVLDTIGDQLKIVLTDTVITNKDFEMKGMYGERNKKRITNKYFLFFEEYKIEVDVNQYGKYEIGNARECRIYKWWALFITLRKVVVQ